MVKSVKIGSRVIQLDKEGFLKDLKSWNKELAVALAKQENIELNEQHWEIIELLRLFHQSTGLSPAMRILVKLAKKELGSEKGNSLYLLSLFPDSPAKIACKIAGLPRPTNCL